MQIVMGYHCVPSIGDYWSSEPSLGVSYIANIMPLKRLKKYEHTFILMIMKPRDHAEHDQAFKVRPVLNHFNIMYVSSMN